MLQANLRWSRLNSTAKRMAGTGIVRTYTTQRNASWGKNIMSGGPKKTNSQLASNSQRIQFSNLDPPNAGAANAAAFDTVVKVNAANQPPLIPHLASSTAYDEYALVL